MSFELFQNLLKREGKICILGFGYEPVVLAVKHGCFLADYSLEKLRELGCGRLPVIINVKGFSDAVALTASGLGWW